MDRGIVSATRTPACRRERLGRPCRAPLRAGRSCRRCCGSRRGRAGMLPRRRLLLRRCRRHPDASRPLPGRERQRASCPCRGGLLTVVNMLTLKLKNKIFNVTNQWYYHCPCGRVLGSDDDVDGVDDDDELSSSLPPSSPQPL